MDEFENLYHFFDDDVSDDEDFEEFAVLVMFPRKRKKFQDRVNHFTYWDDDTFLQRFRLSKQCVMFITDEIRDKITPRTMK